MRQKKRRFMSSREKEKEEKEEKAMRKGTELIEFLCTIKETFDHLSHVVNGIERGIVRSLFFRGQRKVSWDVMMPPTDEEKEGRRDRKTRTLLATSSKRRSHPFP